ncbi:MAG: hypothetical protein RR936_06695 [Carnobacterium sp.]|nr:hypothetical protein [Carnobacterium maltaromaticum]
MSKNYEKWLDRYLRNWCTLKNLEQLVELKQITDAELKLMIKEKEAAN